MSDNELRKSLLLQFYARRAEGRLGIDTGNTAPLRIPEGFAKDDLLRVCERLANSRLIDWKSVPGPGGTILAGAGAINAVGVFAVEKRTPSIFGADLPADPGPAAPAPDSLRHRALAQYADYLLRGLVAAHDTPEERSAAKSRLAGILTTPDGRVVFGATVPALLKLLGASSPTSAYRRHANSV
jgi:hypothetical protein